VVQNEWHEGEVQGGNASSLTLHINAIMANSNRKKWFLMYINMQKLFELNVTLVHEGKKQLTNTKLRNPESSFPRHML
jgi:hypothetical protein